MGYFCPEGTGKWVKRGIERGGVYSWGRRKGQLGTPKRQQGCRRYVQWGTSVQKELASGSKGELRGVGFILGEEGRGSLVPPKGSRGAGDMSSGVLLSSGNM